MFKTFLRPLLLTTLLLAAIPANVPRAADLKLVARVDPRIELLSIVFRLAGNSEYNMNRFPRYTTDIDHYFSKYKDHPAVLMAKSLADNNGVGYDAVMAMAVYLSPPPALKPLVPFSKDVPDGRWGQENATEFVQKLRDFYRDTHFQSFFSEHQPMYKLAELRFQSAVLRDLDVAWYKRFYGEAPRGNFNVVLGMNNGGGNYGPRVLSSEGHEELYAIMGCWTQDDSGNPKYNTSEYLPTLIHEFNHSFVNPVLDAREADFASPAEKVYSHVAAQMKEMEYGDTKDMVNESLVRAAVILYFEAHGETAARIRHRIVREQANGFVWMDKLCALLRNYETNRNHYPTFSSFVPEIDRFYHSLAPQITSEISAFNQHCVHVTGLRPFANRSEDVDPTIKDIAITFDEPLEPADYSINLGPGGKEHFPITGKPEFLGSGFSIKLPVQLKPNWAYSFVLTSSAFQSPEGYPLTSYEVDFKTTGKR
ncbi:MAG TPA: DUF4932 domain-containing protein [Candidatus Acidoferrales bacterium]|nr:DUF4932 domain-containing protein [Candidatus Acidoferrales bacterium]